jgi:cell division protein FtsA
MDTRIGYPNEHLAGDSDEEVASPLYATAVGLLMNAIRNEERKSAINKSKIKKEEEPVMAGFEEEVKVNQPMKERKSVFDRWSEKLKDFLDNAE